MLTDAEFTKQDFLGQENYFQQHHAIHSTLILGDDRMKPSMSIVIPTYKRAHLLKEAINSCLNQKGYDDFNIVITDNDPTRNNETEVLIRSIRSEKIVYYKNQANLGALGNFNRCIEMATGQYAIMLNTDDLLHEHYLDRLSQLLKRYPTADMVLPDIYLEMNGKLKCQKAYQPILRYLSKLVRLDDIAIKLNVNDFILFNPAGSPTGVVYKRETFVQSSGFNPQWHPTGDKILYINFSLKHEVFMTCINAGQYRFLDNITQETGMRAVFVSQGRRINQYLAKKLNKRWVNRYYRGATYYRLHRSSNKQYGTTLDSQTINQLFDKPPHLADFLFFLFVWMIAMKVWVIRVSSSIVKSYHRGQL